ncbi:TPA: hypothetical protein ACT9LW_003209, partial [Legionella pneumophila]
SEYLRVASDAFIAATNEILDLYHKQPARMTVTDEFSMILIKIYQNFMLDVMPSCQLLVDHHKFYSYAILCRSSLDIIIQIKWILSLEGKDQEEAIKAFLSFEGVSTDHKGKKFYEWQDEFTKKTTRQIAIDLNIDREAIIWPLTHNKDKELNLTVFDYLSKITHWNPRVIKDLVGYNKENHMGYTSEYFRMAILALEVFVYCATTFAEIFMVYCLKLDDISVKDKTQNIRSEFQQTLIKFYGEE